MVTEKDWESKQEDIQEETRKVLNEYLFFLKQVNYSEATITSYKWVLEKFFKKT